MKDDTYQIRAVWRRELDIDGLARLVLQLALQLAQQHDEESAAIPDEEAA